MSSFFSGEAYEVLRDIHFRRYLALRFLLQLSVQVQMTTVAWWIYNLTKDPLSLGMLGLCEVIPAVGLAVIGGHVADRYVRKTVFLYALSLHCLVMASLTALAWRQSQFETQSLVMLIYTCVVFVGVARAFMTASIFALFGEILPRRLYMRGSAWTTTLWQVAATLGPAMAGIIYGYTSAVITFSVGLGFAISSFMVATLMPRREAEFLIAKERFIDSLTIGLRFVFRTPVVLSALALDLFAVLFGGAIALFPMFADQLGVGAAGLGWMRAAPFFGAIWMALLVAHRPPGKNAGKILLASVAGFGVCMFMFSLSQSFFLSLAILAVSGALDAVSVTTRGAIVQLMTPSHMRGRVSSVSSVFIASSNELGAFESGVAARILGLVPSVIFGSSMTLLVVGIISKISPSIVKLDLEKLRKEAETNA